MTLVHAFDRQEVNSEMVTIRTTPSRTTPSEVLTDADTRRGGVVATVRLGDSTVVRRSHASNGPQVGGGRQVELRTAIEIEAIQAAAIVARAAVDAALRCAEQDPMQR